MAIRNWEAIAAAYIEGEESLRALSRRLAIPWSTLRDRARREDWDSRRRLRREGRRIDPPSPPGAEQIFRVTDKLVRRAEEILDGEAAVGARELAELMRAIKNAKEIRMLRSALDEREQEARVRALEEKSDASGRGTLLIEFSPEAEEAAR